MKKNLFFKFFLFAVIGTMVTFTSCEDYDDDIDHLQDQITSLSGVSTDLESAKADILAAQSSANDALDKANEALEAAQNAGDADAIAEAQAAADAAQEKVDEVEAKAEELEGLIQALEARVDALEAADNVSQDDLDALAAEVQALEDLIAEMGGLELNNLVLIPDYVADEGGSLPLLNFSPLVTDCGNIAPATLVRYQVSPTNVSEDLIDKDNLYFKANTPIVRSADFDPKADFVSLDDGVLTVRAHIDTKAFEDLEENQIAQLMLFVPTASGDEVSSDWAKIETNPIGDLALVRVPAIEDEEMVWSEYQLAETADEGKALLEDDVTIVDLAYDETLDLLDVVNTMLQGTPWSDFNIDTYNLEYAFDLKDENGETIVYELGTNDTDQQKFLNLVGSEISTRVYDLDGPNPAAQDRTPIVHVMLKSKDGAVDCNVLEGFIKINIVEAKVEPVPPVTIPVTGDVEAGCDDFTLRVGTQQMNEEFYAKAKVSKEFFHSEDGYTWAQEDDGVGTIAEVPDTEDTQSYNLVWTVTSAELADNVGETIEKSGTYTYGSNVIKVTFTANVTQPEIDLGALTLDNYWYEKSYVKFNTAEPASGDDDPTNNTFETDINNVFNIGDMPDGYIHEYFFDEEDNQPVKSYDMSVSNDGKVLSVTKDGETQEVATIDGTKIIYSQTDLAKELLNVDAEFMKARLYMKVYNECEQEVKVSGLANNDAFNVHFLRPVSIEGKAADNFVDAVDFGDEGSEIDLKDVVNLSDWRNYAKNSTDYYFEPDNENYYGFYGVTDITVDIANIVPKGLTSGGEELETLPSSINIDTTAGDPDNLDFGKLTYRNNGAGLGTSFILEVPVTVSYKWGDVSTVVEVEVKETAASPSLFDISN